MGFKLKTWHTTLFGIYYCVEVFFNENHSHMLELRIKLRYMGFYAFSALSRIKSLKLGLFCTKLGTLHSLVYIIVLKWLDFKIIVIC